MSLNGRVVALTGATGLLGPVVARAFAARGARVALLARDRDELDQVAASLPGGRDRHLVVPADLSSADQAVAAAATVREQLGSADVLLHLVGTFRGGAGLAQTASSDWQLLFEVNFWTAVRTLAAFLPQLVDGDRGRIVAVSTPFAQAPSATNAAYAASKAALEAVVLSLARELREQPVTANVVVVRSIRPDRPAGPTAEGKGGWTTPEEIAAAMLWL